MMPESVMVGVVFIKRKGQLSLPLFFRIKPHHTKGYAPSHVFKRNMAYTKATMIIAVIISDE